MRKVTLALSAAVGLCVATQTAVAQNPWQFGPEVNFATNSIGLGVGGRAQFAGLGKAVKVAGLGAYASFDYYFPGSGLTFWEINANGTWDIPNMTGGFKPYVGAGINYANYSVSVLGIKASTSNTGLNILGGTHFNPTPKLNMFGEVRVELRTGSVVNFAVGVLF